MTRNRSLVLRPVPPFRLDAVVWALRRRPDNLVDRWDGEVYSRTLQCGATMVEARLAQSGTASRPLLHLTVSSLKLGKEVEQAAVRTIDTMLGLSADLRAFHSFAATDRLLGPLVARFKGLKPPRFPTVFEALINAVACQQFTLTYGIRLLNRLASKAAKSSRAPPFPSPARIAAMRLASLRTLGFSTQKAVSMKAAAQALVAMRLDLEGLARLDDEAALRKLEALHGVGRWSAEYVMLRGLGRTEVFPGDDVGARNHLQRWLRVREPLDYDGVRKAVRRWHPYAGLVYFHLLLKQLAEDGYLG